MGKSGGRKSTGAASSATPAIAALRAAGINFSLHQFDHDPRATSFGHHAAQMLGQDPERVLKTLVIGHGADFGVAIVPTNRRLSLKAAGAAVQIPRAAMAAPDDARRVTGYVLGGVSPIGGRRPLPTVVDESAAQFPTVLCSAGRRGLEVELAPADLVAITNAVVASIAIS